MLGKNKRGDVKRLALASMFLAMALLMPFLTGQIRQVGSMLCPMHIPVLLCGFFCGGAWGFAVGLLAPLLRSVLFGMPQMFPMAVCMALELAIYGLTAGFMYPRHSVYPSLMSAMIAGRLVWGGAMFVCMGFHSEKFGFHAFLAGAVTNAVPGIILQLVLIPLIVIAAERFCKNAEM